MSDHDPAPMDLDAYVARILAEAPAFTDEQVSRLRSLLALERGDGRAA